MASTSVEDTERTPFFFTLQNFPPVVNGRINLAEFLQSATDLVTLVERLGKLFAPVKYDMQGNIDKIKKAYKCSGDVCLLEAILDDVRKEKLVSAEALLWLNRAILFFELTFKEIIECLQSNNCDVGMKKIYTIAYEGSIKQYHNWVTQQIFTLICRMSPTLPEIIKCIEGDIDMPVFKVCLIDCHMKMHLVRCKIDDFFKENNLFVSNK